jgi:hypothetical protein
MKLISMQDFVLNINELIPKESDQFFQSWQNKKLMIIESYANFLKQPLKLEMFIAINEFGEVLEKPIKENFTDETGFVNNAFFIETNDYLKAEEKVFFKGFYVKMYEEPKDGILGVIKDDNFQFKGIWYEGEEGFRLNDISEKQKIEDLRSCNELTQVAVDRIFG